MCLHQSLPSFLVPSAPPQNVAATAQSSTEVHVSWNVVPSLDQNGVIILYEVQYEPLVTFDGALATSTSNTTSMSIVLSNLEEYVTYNISVRAYTSAGPGVYSQPINEQTLEDSKHHVKYYFYFQLQLHGTFYVGDLQTARFCGHIIVLYYTHGTSRICMSFPLSKHKLERYSADSSSCPSYIPVLIM